MNRDSRLVQGTSILPHPDLLDRLERFRDEHATIIKKALDVEHPDYQIVELHEPLAQMAHDAMDTIRRLTSAYEHMRLAMRDRE